MAKNLNCKDCGTEFEPAYMCPKCGTFAKETVGGTLVIVIGIVLIAILYFLFSGESPKQPRTPSIGNEEVKETMATALNLGGHLCARVTEIRPLALDKRYEVTCIEYRGGSAKVTYIFDTRTGQAFRQ